MVPSSPMHDGNHEVVDVSSSSEVEIEDPSSNELTIDLRKCT